MSHKQYSIVDFVFAGISLGIAAACLRRSEMQIVGAGLAAFGISMFGNGILEAIMCSRGKQDED